MSHKLILLFSLLLPSVAMASEPASGTLIQISGIGVWILLTSLFMTWKQMPAEKRSKVLSALKFWQS